MKPGSTERSPAKLRSSSAAPVRSTSASAVSAITNSERARLWEWPFPALPPPSFSAVARSGFEERTAGKSPNRTTVTSAIATVKAITRKSSTGMAACRLLVSVRRGILPGATNSNRRTPKAPSAKPSPVPAAASMALSVKSSLTTCHRPAPMAARTAISFCREAARASNRLATLAQAISRTRPTAPSRISRAGRTSSTMNSRIGITATLSPSPIHLGLALRNRSAITLISARAWLRSTPGLRRAVAKR